MNDDTLSMTETVAAGASGEGVGEQLAQAAIVERVTPPGAGQTATVIVDPGVTYQIDVPRITNFQQQDNNLVAKTDQGDIVFQDYFVFANTDLPPALTLADGVVIPMEAITAGIGNFDGNAAQPAAGGGGGGGGSGGASFSSVIAEKLAGGLEPLDVLDLLGDTDLAFDYVPVGAQELGIDAADGALSATTISVSSTAGGTVAGTYAGLFEDNGANQHVGEAGGSAVNMTVAFAADDDEQLMAVRIEGFPDGTRVFLADSTEVPVTNGAIGLTPDQTGGLQVVPPANSDADLDLTITGLIVDRTSAIPQYATITTDVAVAVDAVADQAAIALSSPKRVHAEDQSAADAGGYDDGRPVYGLGFQAAVQDRDGSEELTQVVLTISGLKDALAGTAGAGATVSTLRWNGQAITESGTVVEVPAVLFDPANPSTPVATSILATVTFGDGDWVTFGSFAPAGDAVPEPFQVLELDFSGVDGLAIQLPQHSDDDFSVEVAVTSAETELSGLDLTAANNVAVNTATFSVEVQAVADEATLAVADVRGDEDTAIALPIATVLVDQDGSEGVVEITVSGFLPMSTLLWNGAADLPDGFAFDASVGKLIVDASGAALAGSVLDGLRDGALSVVPPANSDTDFTLTVQSVTAEINPEGAVAEGGRTAQTVATFTVTVDAVVEGPAVSVADATIAEDGTFTPRITYTTGDHTDGIADDNEVHTLSIEVPAAWTVDVGNLNGWTLADDGTYRLVVPAAADAATVAGPVMIPLEDSSADRTVTVTLVSQDFERDGSVSLTNNTLSDAATATVTVTPVADEPAIDVGTDVGGEDAWIAVGVAAASTDLDGSETIVSYTLAGLPAGAKARYNDGDGWVTRSGPGIEVPADHIASLQVRPPAQSDRDMALSVSVTVRDADEDGAGAPHTDTFGPYDLAVQLDSNADKATKLSVTGRTDEDGAVVPTVKATFADNDGSESHILYLSVPAGWTVGDDLNGWSLVAEGPYAGRLAQDVTGLGKTVSVAGPELVAPAHSDVDGSLTLTAVVRELNAEGTYNKAANDVRTASVGGTLAVDAVADAADLTLASAGGAEDDAIPVVIAADLVDKDGSEAITAVVVSGLPAGARFVWNGADAISTDVADGTLTIAVPAGSGIVADLAAGKLAVKPAADDSRDITLEVAVTTTEVAPNGAVTTATAVATGVVTVAVAPIANDSALHVADLTVNEDEWVDLVLSVTTDDASESVTGYTLSGLGGSTIRLADGTLLDPVDGVVELTALQAAGAQLRPLADSDDDLSVTVVAHVTDQGDQAGDTAHAADLTRTFTVTVNPVADAPALTVPSTVEETETNSLPAAPGAGTSVSYYGSGDAYVAQTFEAAGSNLDAITFHARSNSGVAAFRVLVTAVEGGEADPRPGTVLFESAPVSLPPGGSMAAYSVAMAGVSLVEGETYAVIIDMATDHEGESRGVAWDFSPTNVAGHFFYNLPAGGSRDDHFQQDWSDWREYDLGLKLHYTDASNPSGDEDTAIAIPLAVAETDVDGSETITAVTLAGVPAGAVVSDGTRSVTVGADGAADLTGWTLADLTVTPPLNYNGTMTLTLSASSSDGDDTATASRQFSVTVVPVNDAPTAEDAAATLSEDAAGVTIDVADLIGDVDEGAVLTVTAGAGSNGGTTSVDGTRISFTPTADYQQLAVGETATETFSYTVTDERGASATRTVTVTVTGANDAPVATLTAAEVHEDGSIVFDPLASASDVDNGARLTLTDVDDAATLGTVAFEFPDSRGEAYAVDRTLFGATANPDVNDPANPSVEIRGLHDGTRDVDWYAFTVQDGERLVLDIDRGYNAGASSFDPMVWLYNATGTLVARNDDSSIDAGSVHGFDSYLAAGPLAAGTYYVAVTGYYQDPANPAGASGYAGGDYVLNASIVPTAASTGFGDAAAVVADGVIVREFTYDTDGRFDHLAEGDIATDQFTYTVTDEHGAAVTRTVTVTVRGANDAPVAVADRAGGGENQSLTIDVLANDTDVDDNHALTLVSASAPKGAVAVVDNRLVFTPGSAFDSLALGQSATVPVTYVIEDEHGARSQATLTLTVTGANDAPTAEDAAATLSEDAAGVTVDVADLVGDVDQGAVLTVTAGAGSNGGTTSVDGTRIGFTPTAGYQHLDSGETATETFSYTVTDEHGASATRTVTVTVTGINDVPVAAADAGSVAEDGSVTFTAAQLLANDSDVDGEALTLTGVAATADTHGTVTLVDGVVTFTPAADYSGPASFTYTVSDGTAEATGIVNVAVTPVADAPALTVPSSEPPVQDFLGSNDANQSVGVLGNSTGNDGYYAQTFVAGGSGLSAIAFQTRAAGSAAEGQFRVLVTTVTGSADNPQPGDILFESAVVSVPTDNDWAVYSVNVAGVSLTEGQTYAVVFDAYSVANDGNNSANMRFGGTGGHKGDPDGHFFHLNVDRGDRSGHFAASWKDEKNHDIGLKLTYADPGAGSGAEDTAIAIPLAVAETDVDGSETITAVSLSGVPAGAVLADGTRSVTVGADGVADLTGWILADLTVTPPQDFNGGMSLTLSATSSDGAATATSSKTFSVIVTAVNDAPVVTAPAVSQTVNEDASVSIAGVVIADVDAGDGAVSATVSADNGTAGFTSRFGQVDHMVFDGADDRVELSMAGVPFGGDSFAIELDMLVAAVADARNAAPLSYAVTGSDNNLLLFFDGNASLNVYVNNRVINTGIRMTDANAGYWQHLAATWLGGALVVSMTDQATGAVQTRTVANAFSGQTVKAGGVLMLGQEQDAPGGSLDPSQTFKGELANVTVSTRDGSLGDADALVQVTEATVTGTVAELNDALATLTFQPAKDYSGQASVTVAVGDNGNSGAGGTLTASRTITIDVAPVADAPKLTAGNRSGAEDTSIAIPVELAEGDIDGSETITSVSLSGIPAGAVLTDGSHSVTVGAGGTADVTGWTLGSLAVTPPANYNGTMRITLSAVSGEGDSAATATKAFTVSVSAVNDAPVFSGDFTGSVEEDGDLVATGTVRATDADAGESGVVAAAHDGRYGHFTIDGDGVWSYTLDNAAAQSLAMDQAVVERFDVASVDGTVRTVEVEVAGANDGPVVEGDRIVKAVLGATAISLNIATPSDVDGDDLLITITGIPTNGAIRLGDAQIKAGDTLTASELSALTFTGNTAGQSTLTYTVSDGRGGDAPSGKITFATESGVEYRQLVNNGDFTAGLQGWTSLTRGSSSVYVDYDTRDLNFVPTPGPLGAGGYALIDGLGAGARVLYQDFHVPVGTESVTVQYDMFVNNWFRSHIVGAPDFNYSWGQNQHYRVDLIRPDVSAWETDLGIVANLAMSTNGAPANNYNYSVSSPWVHYYHDISGNVVDGTAYRLRFGDVDNQNYFDMGVDRVNVTATVRTDALMDGGQGDDILVGGAGNDRLFGADGLDGLFGDEGSDILIGGFGDDHLTGGGGADRFVFTSTGDGHDVVADFNTATDIIDLDALFEALGAEADLTVATADGQTGGSAQSTQFVVGVEGHSEFSVTVNATDVTTVEAITSHIVTDDGNSR